MYTKKLPKGKAHSRPDYTDPGGCTPASKEFEFEWEGEKEKKPRRIDMPAERVTVNICDKIQRFTVDDYSCGADQLSASQQALVKRIKSAIWKRVRTCGKISMVVLTGHASTEGDAGRNKDLGLRRAQVMKSLLEGAFRGARVITTSKGETKPLVSPDPTDAEQRKNRRVEIFVQ
jgi:outer membrane protein OmpA-like peptidoglycan-associated protein